jgi:CHAD domain-containing protein
MSLLQLLSPLTASNHLQRVEHCLKKHLDAFDDLRDTQVQLSALRGFRKTFRAADRFYGFLKKQEVRLECTTLSWAGELRAKKLAKMVRTFREEAKDWLKHAGPQRANRVLLFTLEQAFDSAIRLKERIDNRDPRSIHATRIAFKKFRYMVEVLAGRWAWADKHLLSRMRSYQGLMGDIQDAEVFRRAFAKFGDQQQSDPESTGKFAHRLVRHRDDLIARYLAAADRLAAFRPPPADPSLPRSRKRAGHLD